MAKLHTRNLKFSIGIVIGLAAASAHSQDQYDGPIIDMHMHASSYYLELDADGRPLPFDCYPARWCMRVQ